MILHVVVTVLSTIISLIVAISGAGAAAQDKNEVWSLADYQNKVGARTSIGKMLTFGLMPADRFEVEYDDVMGTMFDELAVSTGFDAKKVVASWPDIYYFNRWLYKLMPGQFNEWRDQLLAKADEAESAGDWTNMALNRTFGVSVAMPTKLFMTTEELEPEVYKVILMLSYADGSQVRFDPKITYNKASGYVTGEGGNSLIGTGYAMNVGDSWAYTTVDSPQRALGYIKLYDDLLLKTTNMVNVDTARLKFTYKNMDWMVQLWKGRYFVTTGGEVGVYHKPKDRKIDFYDCASNDELIPISFRIRLKDTSELLIDRPQTSTWWMTGFSVRPYVYGPGKITLESEITPYDAEFSTAICGALDKEVAAGTLSYTILDNGNISIIY